MEIEISIVCPMSSTLYSAVCRSPERCYITNTSHGISVILICAYYPLVLALLTVEYSLTGILASILFVSSNST